MQITHAEAHNLIQYDLDKVLKPQEKNILQAHLNDCAECRAFAEEIKGLENLLLPVMIKHWAVQPAPLLMENIAKKSKRNSQLQTSIILTTRKMMIGIVLVVFVFSAWQFSQSGRQIYNQMPVSVLPIPTPSGKSTSTKISFQNCEESIYRVKENDTLESIASQFSVAKDKIMAINHLSTESIHANMELQIPICISTPTGTTHPSTLTTTFTPLIDPTTSTPGGS